MIDTYTSNETERLGLEGRTVRGLLVSEYQDWLKFIVDGPDGLEPIEWITDGDCCSETWFSDITNLHTLIGHTVKAIAAEEMDDPEDGRSRQEYDRLTVLHVVTEVGMCNITYRNSSNGYYGGSVYLSSSPDNNRKGVPITDSTWRA